ncbi:MAG: PIN domain-containing protein [Thermoleophilaceae bacterium]|nr:PIN domain-containing protein [Thermoleophilaceae bacterium]
MIVDTNLLLRIIERDAGAHGQAARARVEDARIGEPLTVFAATVLEVVFVLESGQAGYGWDRDSVSQAVEAIADEPGFAVEHGEQLRVAALTYRDRSIDLHDCYLDALAREHETRILSFDRDLARLGTGERP